MTQLIHRHVTLKANKKGRDFFVGDLHGMYDHLLRAMDTVQFDDKADRIISVGDLIDRGPDSVKAIKLLKNDWFFAVRGNHEEMFLDEDPIAEAMHKKYGGEWANSLDPEKKAKYRKRLHALPVALTIKTQTGLTVGVCHAEWPNGNWAKIEKAVQSEKIARQMVWGRSRIRAGKPQKDKTADLLIHGHSPVDAPCRLGDALFIDTGCVYGGSLTLLQLEHAFAMQAHVPHKQEFALKKGLKALLKSFTG